jgi:copper chaperone CopZ
MKTKKSSGKLIGAGILSAIAASLCCITPVLALIAGSSGIAASSSWLEPVRPYLIGITIIVLAFAWYQKLKSKKTDTIDCDCEEERPSFWQSRKFLAIITVFAIIMLAFPSYSHMFYTETKPNTKLVIIGNIEIVDLKIKGMTCTGCEEHIKHAVSGLPGFIEADADYNTGKAIVKIDTTIITINEFVNAINQTGYEVVTIKTN